MTKLLGAYQLGPTSLKNRVVMAPMTRSRALQNIPNDLMAEYYRQRAGAGLIITEGTAPSPNGLGYPRIPGVYSDAQVAGWKKVTAAVHEAGGKIFLQVMHVGRIAHPLNLPEGAEMVAPSALAAPGEMYTDQEGPKAHPTPREMGEADLKAAIEEYAHAARRAIEAGFDGVEVHAANGYLLEQFLSPTTNKRSDAYGGSAERRNRFVLEVVDAVVDAIGSERTGIRISPYGVFNGIEIHDELDPQYLALAKALSERKLVYLHLVDHEAMGAPAVPDSIKRGLREAFAGIFIASGGFDRDSAEKALEEGRGDLVAFGRPFIANPDLVHRFEVGAELAEPKADSFYTPGAEGYTDYVPAEG